jgi:Acyl-CoA carboxylase epsilon subunit
MDTPLLAGQPLRVLRGNPGDDEMAAVLVLLRALARRPEEGPTARPAAVTSGPATWGPVTSGPVTSGPVTWGPVTLPWPAATAS